MRDGCDEALCLCIIGPCHERDRALANGRNKALGIKDFTDMPGQSEPHQACHREDDTIECSIGSFPEAALDIPAQGFDHEIGTQAFQHGLPAQ
jgi:hypothetical protein